MRSTAHPWYEYLVLILVPGTVPGTWYQVKEW